MINPQSYLVSWKANHGFYSPRFSIHPACKECGKLYPEMRFESAIHNFCDSHYSTACCDAGTYDWKFVVGLKISRKRINLHKQRAEILARRGVWTSLCR